MDEQKNTEQKKQASHFMAFYVVGLFSIALVLILLSYLTQTRADDQIAHAETRLQEQVSATQGIQAKMEVLQEANNDQAQRIAALEQSLSRAMDENEMLEKRAEAQEGLIKACQLARSEESWPQMHEELDRLAQEYGLEALDGSDPKKLLWTAEERKVYNELRALQAEPKEE